MSVGPDDETGQHQDEVYSWIGRDFHVSKDEDGHNISLSFSSVTQLPRNAKEVLRPKHILWVKHKAFCGLCEYVQFGEDGKIICKPLGRFARAKENADGTQDIPWELIHPGKNSNSGQNAQNVNFCLIPPSSEEVTSEGIAWILPPVKLNGRMSIFNIDSVDTVNQKFSADVFCELRLRSISQFRESDHVRELLDMLSLTSKMMDFLTVSEYKSDVERWDQYVPSSMRPGTYDFCFKVRVKAVFNESMELHNFPWDVQELNVPFALSVPDHQGIIIVNDEYPSVFQMESFQLGHVFRPLMHDTVISCQELSNPNESSAGYRYARFVVRVYLCRRGGYYVSNVVLPMALLTMLAMLSCGIEDTGEALSTGDRLSVTLTLLLTAVAYKFVVASSLPQVSYLTLLDTYVLMCFFFMIIAALENVAYPAILYAATDPSAVVDEKVIVAVYLIVFALANVVWATISAVKRSSSHLHLGYMREFETMKRAVSKAMNESVKSAEGTLHDATLRQMLLQKLLSRASNKVQETARRSVEENRYIATGGQEGNAPGRARRRQTSATQSKELQADPKALLEQVRMELRQKINLP